MDRGRVLLINPLVGDDYEFTRNNRPLPLGLLGVSAALLESFDVRILDQRMDKDFARRMREELDRGPLCVGLHVMGGPQILKARKLSRQIKQISNVPVVWGGPFPTLAPEAILAERAVDFVICGEGEHAFLQFVSALRQGLPMDGMPGLARRENGKVLQNALGPRPDMDALPDLPYFLLDLMGYNWSAGNNRLEGLNLQIETSRGCSSSCIFCYNPYFYGRSWRAQSAARTLDSMEILVRKDGATHLDVIDDSYFEDLERVSAISDGMTERRFGIRYLVNGGKVGPILAMSDDALDSLRRSGCETIHLGAESGSDRMLGILAKGITSAQIRASNIRLKTFDIMPSYYFICGLPGEREEDLRQSTQLMIDLLKDNPATKIIAAFSFTPFAGTPAFKIALSQGMTEPDTLDGWSQFDTLNPLQPWLEARQHRRVKALFFLCLFIDDKIRDISPSPFIRLVARLYRPVARWRVERLRLGWALEEWIGRRILAWTQRAQRRRHSSGDGDIHD
ncbi:B12-binding domain-containing radical SAM protein [Thermodesulfobacteriota bacterium]